MARAAIGGHGLMLDFRHSGDTHDLDANRWHIWAGAGEAGAQDGIGGRPAPNFTDMPVIGINLEVSPERAEIKHQRPTGSMPSTTDGIAGLGRDRPG
jgi:hypothetical protein